MTSAVAWLRDPSELVGFLRSRGLRIGSGEALRVAAVLDRLEQQGRPPRDIETAARVLAPLLTTNAADQQSVRPLLEAYERAVAGTVEERRPANSERPADLQAPRSVDVIAKPHAGAARIVGWAVVAAIAAIVGLIVWSVWQGLSAWHTSATYGESSRSLRLRSDFPLTRLILVGVDKLSGLRFAVLPWLAWLLLRQWEHRRPTRLRGLRKPNTEPSHLRPRSSSPVVLFGSTELRLPLQSLRAHRREPATELDVRATARATTAAAGRPVWVYGTKNRLPDYPIIFEQLSSKDHLVTLGRAVTARLREERVGHSVYTYSTDPRKLRNEAGAAVSLIEVQSRQGEDMLLLVSDGEALIDPLSGGLRKSAKALLAWKNPVLLTPAPLEAWSRRERTLISAGFVVLPATEKGLQLLGDFVVRGREAARPEPEMLSNEPTALTGETYLGYSLLQNIAPTQRERDAVVADLAVHLPGPAFDLMCILAVFPQIRVDLTLAAGLALKQRDGKPLLDEESFAALAWLPWFRFGTMPAWLRQDLVECIPPGRRDEVRKFYRGWLTTVAPAASRDTDTDELIVVRRAPSRRLLLREAARDPSSPVRDSLFLTFDRGEPVASLDLEAPGALTRLLRPRGLSPELAFAIVAALLSAAALAFPERLPALLSPPSVNAFLYAFLAFGLLSIACWHVRALGVGFPQALLQPLLYSACAYACVCLLGNLLPIYQIGFAIIGFAPLALALVDSTPRGLTPLKWPGRIRWSFPEALALGVVLAAAQQIGAYVFKAYDASPSFPLYAMISSAAIANYFSRASGVRFLPLFGYSLVGSIGAVLPAFVFADAFGPQSRAGLLLGAAVVGGRTAPASPYGRGAGLDWRQQLC